MDGKRSLIPGKFCFDRQQRSWVPRLAHTTRKVTLDRSGLSYATLIGLTTTRQVTAIAAIRRERYINRPDICH